LHCPTVTQPEVVEKIIHQRQHYQFRPMKIAMYLKRYRDVAISTSGVANPEAARDEPPAGLPALQASYGTVETSREAASRSLRADRREVQRADRSRIRPPKALLPRSPSRCCVAAEGCSRRRVAAQRSRPLLPGILREKNGASKPPAFAGWTHAFSIRVWAHAVQHDDGRIDDGATDAVLGPPAYRWRASTGRTPSAAKRRGVLLT
jgi:hypothetical protein